MSKATSNKEKSQVSKDFQATLQTIIRTLSKEELQIIDAFGTSEEKKDFYVSYEENSSISLSNSESKGLVRRTSVLRNKGFNKYELVVDRRSFSIESNDIKDMNTKPVTEISVTKLFTRPIRTSYTSSDSVKVRKSKPENYFLRFFPSLNYSKIPFERTTVASLPYYLNIETEYNRKLSVNVTEFYTIDLVKLKIFKKLNIEPERQALFHNDKRLEGSSLLYSYGINSNSLLKLKLCQPITIVGVFNTTRTPLTVYTSITGVKLTELFAKECGIDSGNIELKCNDLVIEDNKELFTYNLLDQCEIEIVEQKPSTTDTCTGNRTVDKFIQMTNNLTKCKCHALRIRVISDLFLMVLHHPGSEEEIIRNRQFLGEFDKSRHYHHMSCFKLLHSPGISSTHSQCSSFSELVTTSYSGSDSSLKEAVFAESKRVDRHESLKIDAQYIKLVAESKDFKVFKHLLKEKIGTKCNLRSVAMLYKYARETVRFIGLDENENSPEILRILDFTKSYFDKNFKKVIVAKGGLDALTLTESDVD